MNRFLQIDETTIGTDSPLLIIAGPCVLENKQHALDLAEQLQCWCNEAQVSFIFKGSFDKANRTSVFSKRGPGIEQGLDILLAVKENLGCMVTTDIHEAQHAEPVSKVADFLQIPAFLCRQTDLLVAAAESGAVVNVKKGQFLSPDEMRNVVGKLQEANCDKIILTERGSFFGYNRLVNDFIGLGDMMEIGPPVCFDVTHSTQLPGAGKGCTAGRPDRAFLLAKAATAAGVDALFLECHENPSIAPCDASTMQPIQKMQEIINTCAAIALTVDRAKVKQ
ncbi:MAG: 3-deoxy-8-phosphooctulonate synthase [Phycisphaerae bacterium]|nr:3-deoxy-8-phosphooctulonate synthase [Phycisphaerae bacterium]|tara:strand:+ start:3784 stop:4620 length:837 start_codon:yes stop_codon:yes gene_type:complete